MIQFNKKVLKQTKILNHSVDRTGNEGFSLIMGFFETIDSQLEMCFSDLPICSPSGPGLPEAERADGLDQCNIRVPIGNQLRELFAHHLGRSEAKDQRPEGGEWKREPLRRQRRSKCEVKWCDERDLRSTWACPRRGRRGGWRRRRSQ
jgi:hypothetical protein